MSNERKGSGLTLIEKLEAIYQMEYPSEMLAAIQKLIEQQKEKQLRFPGFPRRFVQVDLDSADVYGVEEEDHEYIANENATSGTGMVLDTFKGKIIYSSNSQKEVTHAVDRSFKTSVIRNVV